MHPPISIRRQSGTSLIEIMVAAVIFGMSLTGILSLLGIGAELENSDGLRRQARIHAVSTLEQAQYLYTNYAAVAAGTINTPVTMKKSNGQDLAGNIRVVVTGPTNIGWNDPADATGAIPIPYKTISVQVEWNWGGKTESVALQKSISDMPL